MIRKLSGLKIGQEIRQDGPETHLAKAGTPTMGGTLIIISFVVSVLLWQEVTAFYTWVVVATAIGLGFLGFLDDFLKITKKNSDGLRAGVKFSGQILVSLVIMIVIYVLRNDQTTLLYIPFSRMPSPTSVFSTSHSAS
jgi:phospho-N-acetylmuramoyl-pentapeptide-transferase